MLFRSYATMRKIAVALELDVSTFAEFTRACGFGKQEKEPGSALGAAIRARRKGLALSINDLAVRLDMTSQWVSLMERGKATLLKDERLEQVAHALEMDPETLRSLRPEHKKPGPKASVRITSATPLGAFLVERRLALGLTRDAVAVAAGISPSALFCLEKGETKRPRFHVLEKISGVLQCDASALLALVPNFAQSTGALSPSAAEAAPAVPPSDDIARIMELSGIGADDAQRKGAQLLRRLLERQRAGYALFFAKDGDLVELELLL